MRQSKYSIIFLISLSLSFIFIFISLNAHAEAYGYRVTSSSKTVIQIARDVYNDERLWKKIAYWNNLTPPYPLTTGQILVLPIAPKIELPQENKVLENEIPSPRFLLKRPSVAQELKKDSTYYIYSVNERAPSLSMVAIENYGNIKMAPIIAKWNGLTKNSKLSLGQKLKLKVKPALPDPAATSYLVNRWNSMGNIDMVERLGGKVQTHSPNDQINLSKTKISPPSNSIKSVVNTPPTKQIETKDVSSETKVSSGTTSTATTGSGTETTASTPVPVPAPSTKSDQLTSSAPQAPIDPELEDSPATKTTPTAGTNSPQEKPRAPANESQVEKKSEVEPTTETYWLGEENSKIFKKLSLPRPQHQVDEISK